MRPLGVEIAAMLAARGVEEVFGIPGVHNIELYRGIEAAGIRHVLARHEQGAGFMADGYARATGRPGVAFVISGPGLTNIMTPMGQAYSDSVPMLVISTVLDETAARKGQLHQMRDQEGAGRCVSDWSETARTPEAAYALIARALEEFATRRPRPKHIQIPIGVLGAPAPPPPAHRPPDRAGGPALRASDAAPVARSIAQAERPVLILGGGARGASDDIARFRARCPIPVFTTYAGRGIVPPDDPLLFGSYLARPGSVDVLAAADLVIAVGTELAEVDLWRADLGYRGAMIRVDADAAVLAGAQGAVAGVHATARSFFGSLADAAALPARFAWTRAEIAETRARWRAEVDAARPGIVPVCEALRSALPERTMIYSDMTQFAYAAKEVWDMPAPGHWHHPTGFGTLGYALPAAIGGAVGHGGPVLAIAGDYGFQYTMQELGTAAELGLPLPVLIWDNAALGEIRDNMIAAQIAPNAVHALNPEWEPLARAYGCRFAAPGNLDGLCAAVADALGAARPTLIRATPGMV